MISKKSLKKFTELYSKQFGVELTEEEAASKSAQLINLYLAIYGHALLENSNESKSEEITK